MHPTHPVLRALCLSATLLGAACTAPEANPAEPKYGFASEVLAPANLGTIERLHNQGGVILASQPSPADFREAKEQGVRTVINLREAAEVTEFDEPALIESLGLNYYDYGFKSPESMTDRLLDDARVVLDNPDARPILMHCSSANRVGAVWLVYRVLDGGLEWDAALAEARQAGLKSAAFEQRASAYIASARKAER